MVRSGKPGTGQAQVIGAGFPRCRHTPLGPRRTKGPQSLGRGGVTGQQETLRDVRRKINRIRQCEQRGSNTRIVVGGHSVYH